MLISFSKDNNGKLIDTLFPDECTEIILEEWNFILSDAINHGIGTKNGRKVARKTSSSKRQIGSTEEAFQFTGVFLKLCLSELSSRATALKNLFEKRGNFPPKTRIEEVMPQFGLSNEGFDRLTKKFSDINYKVVDCGTLSVVDETSISWTGNSVQKAERRKEENVGDNKFVKKMRDDLPNAPVIPSKPHPVAILIHGDVFKFPLSKKCFAMSLSQTS